MRQNPPAFNIIQSGHFGYPKTHFADGAGSPAEGQILWCWALVLSTDVLDGVADWVPKRNAIEALRTVPDASPVDITNALDGERCLAVPTEALAAFQPRERANHAPRCG